MVPLDLCQNLELASIATHQAERLQALALYSG